MAPSMSLRPEWDVLLSAAHKNLPERIREMILKDGVDPSHSNAVGQTALHIAALWGNGRSFPWYPSPDLTILKNIDSLTI
jgi:ankyrin repeat protein